MRHYNFKPSVSSLMLMLLGVALFTRLGFWQLDRAMERDALNVAREQRAMAAPVRVPPPTGETLGELRYRSVILRGQYDRDHEFLLDNQQNEGVVGFQVLTPFRLEGSSSSVMINRGWIPLGGDRLHPGIPTPPPEGVVTISGLMDEFYRVGFQLEGASEPQLGWPSLLQVPDPERLSVRLGYQVLAYQVLLNPQADGGFLRTWQVARMDADKNRGYALQWFLFAALSLFLFVRHGLKRSSP